MGNFSNPPETEFSGLVVLGKQEITPDLARRFFEAAKKLTDQGAQLQQVRSGTDITLFAGRHGKDIIDIQVQVGEGIKQLYVTWIGEDEALQLRFNHYHAREPIVYDDDVEKLVKGKVDPELKRNIERRYFPYFRGIRYDERGDAGDFARLTEILESTVLDKKLLDVFIKHEEGHGYIRKGHSDQKPLGKLLARLPGLPGNKRI